MVHVYELGSSNIAQIDRLTFLIRFDFKLNLFWNRISNNEIIVFLFNPFVLTVEYVEFSLVYDHIFWIKHDFDGNRLVYDQFPVLKVMIIGFQLLVALFNDFHVY